MDSNRDWDQEWEDYKQNAWGLAMICGTCGDGSVSTCQCVKQKWINYQKELAGLPADKSEFCYRCKQNVIYVYMHQKGGETQHYPTCKQCLQQP